MTVKPQDRFILGFHLNDSGALVTDRKTCKQITVPIPVAVEVVEALNKLFPEGTES